VAALNLPAGVFSMLHGGGTTIGMALVRHPAATAVGFTGSQAAGRALFDAAAKRAHPIPVFAEMSSLNPVFLLPEALRTRGDSIADALLGSFTMGVGQFCTKPGLVFALRGEATDSFIARLGKLVAGAARGTMLSEDIRASFEKNRSRVTGVTGVEVLASAPAQEGGCGSNAFPSVAVTTAKRFRAAPELATEAFGPFTLVIVADDMDEMVACAAVMEGQLTATLHATEADLANSRPLLAAAEQLAGRLIINGFPTGVEVSPAMNHGGPWPATSDVRYTSVGTAAMLRFARPVCYQGFPDALLPPELQNANPGNIQRMVNGELTRSAL
jgi:alpha-ketoglutaric semialdehyde dehydrogenase